MQEGGVKEVKMFHSEKIKQEKVAGMFNSIAAKYDFLNHFLSFNRDKYWRRVAIQILKESNPRVILDVATGTGDFALEALKLNPDRVTGIDISEKMLDLARIKASGARKGDKLDFFTGKAEEIPFQNSTFDAAISGFGVRNFANLQAGIREIIRILKPGGHLVILEFSKPKTRIFGTLYSFYFSKILPVVGGWISGIKPAYEYLPESVTAFLEGDHFIHILEESGFENCSCFTLTFGIVSVYSGFKR